MDQVWLVLEHDAWAYVCDDNPKIVVACTKESTATRWAKKYRRRHAASKGKKHLGYEVRQQAVTDRGPGKAG